MVYYHGEGEAKEPTDQGDANVLQAKGNRSARYKEEQNYGLARNFSVMLTAKVLSQIYNE